MTKGGSTYVCLGNSGRFPQEIIFEPGLRGRVEFTKQSWGRAFQVQEKVQEFPKARQILGTGKCEQKGWHGMGVEGEQAKEGLAGQNEGPATPW